MSEEARARLISQVRDQVNKLLEASESPSDVSFALSFVATELGRHATENDICVMPILLGGVNAAIRCANDEQCEEEAAVTLETEIPVDTKIH